MFIIEIKHSMWCTVNNIGWWGVVCGHTKQILVSTTIDSDIQIWFLILDQL